MVELKEGLFGITREGETVGPFLKVNEAVGKSGNPVFKAAHLFWFHDGRTSLCERTPRDIIAVGTLEELKQRQTYTFNVPPCDNVDYLAWSLANFFPEKTKDQKLFRDILKDQVEAREQRKTETKMHKEELTHQLDAADMVDAFTFSFAGFFLDIHMEKKSIETRRSVVPGSYGIVTVAESNEDRQVVSIVPNGYNAEQLREAAHFLNQIAEVLEDE